MNNKLQSKDLINIGIFAAIYFAVVFAVSMLGVIPIFIPLLDMLVPLIGGIPMMLYFSKIKKFGMLTISGLLEGILMLLTRMGYWCILTGTVFGLIADLMLKHSGYKSTKMEILAHGVFSIWVFGAFIPIVITRDNYYEKLIPTFGQEYADTLMGYIRDWILPVMAMAAFVAGIIGAWIGRKIFKKHFERAGIV
ncbi:MAG: MptD family putative ECF transporter S component [Blautia sp.]